MISQKRILLIARLPYVSTSITDAKDATSYVEITAKIISFA